ncbi:Serine/threonine-protein kinase gad8 [Vanrija pseudolonga]|uniref:Serine/threonine-protein kinase gad8 n=1 Tax=Vanrija pseudolonga TaxID=143232 RepID=A0AAF0YAJ8_9TREE|nr:Serine/threonine-protein kinase gad8 [Vanrija pseudolonga]
MSWKLGKKFKDSGLLKSHNTPSPADNSRSTTPTPGNPHPGESTPILSPPVARSGILRIRVTAGKGLSLPQGVPVPPPVQTALQQHPTSALSASLSSSPRVTTSNRAGPNRDSLQRKQLWWLPYVVLEFDKNEVLVDALGGDLANPRNFRR